MQPKGRYDFSYLIYVLFVEFPTGLYTGKYRCKNTITILDAGMGKTLSLRGVEIPPTIWSANALIAAPEAVLEIHRENISAGARMITTNSYGIIPADLEGRLA